MSFYVIKIRDKHYTWDTVWTDTKIREMFNILDYINIANYQEGINLSPYQKILYQQFLEEEQLMRL